MSALAGGGPPWLAQAGMGWALWDLSGHVSDQDTDRRALHLAAEFLADVPKRDWRAAFASRRFITALARSDAGRGYIPSFRRNKKQYAARKSGVYGKSVASRVGRRGVRINDKDITTDTTTQKATNQQK